MAIGTNIGQMEIWRNKRLNMLSTCILLGVEVRFFICRFLHFLMQLVISREAVGANPRTHLKGGVLTCIPQARGVGVKEWKQAKRAGSWAGNMTLCVHFNGTRSANAFPRSQIGSKGVFATKDEEHYPFLGNIKWR